MSKNAGKRVAVCVVAGATAIFAGWLFGRAFTKNSKKEPPMLSDLLCLDMQESCQTYSGASFGERASLRAIREIRNKVGYDKSLYTDKSPLTKEQEIFFDRTDSLWDEASGKEYVEGIAACLLGFIGNSGVGDHEVTAAEYEAIDAMLEMVGE